LNSSLIRGQSLFGVKPNCNLENNGTGVFQSKNHRQKCSVTGGGTIQDFDMFALDYDSDTLFCLSILETNTILH
jgi:hypothetical protein